MVAKIHHTQKKQAEQIGAILSIKGGQIEAFWPERGASVLGATATEAIEKMRTMQKKYEEPEELDEEVEEEGENGEENESSENEEEGDEGGDEAGDEAAEEKVSSSVVKEKYRLKYRELGHPANCGDWLAQFLENQTLTKQGSDIWRFRDICEMNGVDMSKYKVSGNGWQGRFRMTGRNMLAKVLFERDVVLVPGMNGETEEYPVPSQWKAEQRFSREAK